MYSATLMLITDQRGRRCVVTEAGPIVWIAPEVIDPARDPDRPHRIPGDMEVDGDLIAFGTPGEGIGRVTYRLTGVRVDDDFGAAWHVAEREDPTTTTA